MSIKLWAAALAVVTLTGCASVQLGDKTVEAELKQFKPVAGKTSLYVCREPAMLVATGVTTQVMVDGRDIGAVKPNMFVHALVEPGTHGVGMRNDGIAGTSSPWISIQTQAGEVAFLWIGVTGKGFGTYTIDHFESPQKGRDCVTGAAYSVKAN